jgi:transposase
MNQEPIHPPNTQEEKPVAKAAKRAKPNRPPRKAELTKEQTEQILGLHKLGFGTRRIEKKAGIGRKVIRNVLEEHGLKENPVPRPSSSGQQQSKLDPYREQIREKVEKHLTGARILREIRKLGYAGSKSILNEYIRKIRVNPKPAKRVKRRFETGPSVETQVDWSPYRVEIGGMTKVVHAFAATLCWCRKTHLRFYLNEKESTLLEAHIHAFEDFCGVTQRIVYDRMATVVLGTIGPDHEPLWHERFLEFAKHYGFKPFLCKRADPDRKGKVERYFRYQSADFLRGTSFESMDHLNAEARIWLDTVSNARVHGTTKEVPSVRFEQEKPLLIELPSKPFLTCDEEQRGVGKDAVISISGTPYNIPSELADRNVSVRLYAEHFEVLDAFGQIAFTRRYVGDAEKGKLKIDDSLYPDPQRYQPGPGTDKLEKALNTRYPSLINLVSGIKLRMKSLAHIHLRTLLRLASEYGDKAFLQAATRAQDFKRYDAYAVKRILERDFPLPDEEPIRGLQSQARLLLALGEVESGSLDDYAYLDSTPSHQPAPQSQTQEEPQAARPATDTKPGGGL